MKAKVFLGLLLLTALFTACKNEKAVDNLKVKDEKPVVDQSFKVIVKAIVKKEDDFALLYTEDNTINFYSIPALWQHVKGSDSEQEVVFTLPTEAYPTQLRFDFGLKQDQENIILKSFKFIKGEKVFEAIGPDVFKYLRADENQCSVTPTTGEIIAKKKDGKRLTPSLYPIETEMTKAIESVNK